MEVVRLRVCSRRGATGCDDRGTRPAYESNDAAHTFRHTHKYAHVRLIAHRLLIDTVAEVSAIAHHQRPPSRPNQTWLLYVTRIAARYV